MISALLQTKKMTYPMYIKGVLPPPNSVVI